MLSQVSSVIADVIALALISILLTFTLTDYTYASKRTRFFQTCVFLALVATSFNAGMYLLARVSDQLSATAICAMGSVQQLLTGLVGSLSAYYALTETRPGPAQIFAHRLIRLAPWLLFGVHALMVFLNGATGLLFSSGENGLLIPGPLNSLPCLITLINACVVSTFYFLKRKYSESNFNNVMVMLPLTALIGFAAQCRLPHVPLCNITNACVLLIFFISFQRQRVHRDRLTGVGNRAALSALVESSLAHNVPFTLQQVSLRRFRRVNRRFGPDVGDQLLREIALAIRRVSPQDRCYRFNGTDFIIYHEHEPNGESAQVIDALRERFQQPFTVGDNRIMVGAFYAQASYPTAGSTEAELINNLEYCQLQARDMADGSLVVYDESVRLQMDRRERLSELINASISEDRFFLCYQPIYDAADQTPCAAEALLRMRDSDGSIVSPGIFIPAAEESGAIIPITWMVLDKVCAFIDRHRDAKLPPISINFSVQQFAEQDMCQVIGRYLRHYNVRPEQIKIEITERVFTENSSLLMENVQGLQDMGVGLYLDDFGTGYSNLSSVITLPFEVVKVDRTLLASEQEVKSDTLLTAVVSGLKHLGAQVLMEGVETGEQLVRVMDIGVDRMQGFYYARPMEEDAFLIYMHNAA